MELSEFLLARIAEDEAHAWDFERDPETRLPRFWTDRFHAECDAKRRIVTTAAQARLLQQLSDLEVDGYVGAMTDVLKFLALPYANHPDYREEWKP
jgi:hypothetical protein